MAINVSISTIEPPPLASSPTPNISTLPSSPAAFALFAVPNHIDFAVMALLNLTSTPCLVGFFFGLNLCCT